MRLDRKDALSTVILVAGLAMALSVTQGWDWPLLGGVREGIIALGIAGLGACVLGSQSDRFYRTDPFGLATIAVTIAAIAIAIVGGLITGSVQFLVALMLVTIMLWGLATFRHAVEGRSAPRIGAAT